MLATPSPIAPAHAVNITVYHINPHAQGAIPVNMDTGNGIGDLFFDLFEVVIQPLACHQGAKSGHQCANPEASGKDLVVNKLTLEVDSRYSDYAMCNIGVNGTDGHGHKCENDTYCCFCHRGSFWPEKCKTTVGREDLKSHFGHDGRHHFACKPDSPTYYCYMAAVFNKLNSTELDTYWYSSLAAGYCDAPGATECTWRVVSVDKIVKRECHARVFGELVQATQPSAACLDACGAQKTNSSSPCWTDCFYRAAMGPSSGTPGGKAGGMSLAALTAAWEKPFAPEAEGGCPAMPQMAPWFEQGESRRGAIDEE